MSAILEVKSLRKIYGNDAGVTEVNMSVEEGTIHGFLGLNGSGKTTTMKCLLGLLRIDAGAIYFQGRRVDPTAVSYKSRTGFSPELPSFPPYLTGLEVMQLYGRMRGLSGSRRNSESRDLLRRVGLDGAENKRVGKYSRGRQAKLGVAVSLINEPDLLILDEPTSGMDPGGAAIIRDILRETVRDGSTVLLSSHLLFEVQSICRNITIINRGRTLREGTVKDLIQGSGNTTVYIAEFNSISDALLRSVEGLGGVSGCTVSDPGRIRVEVTGDTDIRESVARIAMNHGSLMLSCIKQEMSLEELFLELVSEDTAGRTTQSTTNS